MKNGKKFLINVFTICLTLGIIAKIFLNDYREKEIKSENEYNTQILSLPAEQNLIKEEKASKNITEETKQETMTKNIKEDIIDEYRGYKVIAKLQIPNIDLETYVLEEYSNNALNISVTKFWGVNPNEVGNLCIAGHNFQNKNMFHNLRKLKNGDSIFITSNKEEKLEYTIYDVYKVLPDDVRCLSQATNGKKEITLITCTNDSKKRIIIKAREK